MYGTPPPPARKRKWLGIVLGILGGVVILAIVGVAILMNLVGNASNKARTLADDFTNLLIRGETHHAYDQYLDASLMEQLSRDQFTSGVESLELDDTCRPSYSTVDVSSRNGTNAADVAGKLDCSGKSIELAYRFEGTDELKIVTLRLLPQN
ncbi:hypothetical protein [Arthrobacter sp. ISL-30]|uniref:hypothetical protein n=1 Tax=Arthrobacter sp. ISL-30 TaxID=2819109 RepID=UPI001BE509B6|nr:hypothetical protein [Arthrobacter sp. ISL-30]MBT2513119.1 hypothetical protein [Arthrobacter sp. ISL-30]